MKLGEFDIQVLSDGTFRLDGGAMFGVIPKVLWEKTNPANDKNRILLGLNCLLIRTPDDTIIVDTGIGNLFDDKFQNIFEIDKSQDLLANLRAAGLSAEDVTKVILTHLHFDHCGGNCRKNSDGEIVPTFPNATYFCQAGELEYAKNPDPRSKGSYLKHNWEPLETAGQLQTISGNQEIVPGIEGFVTGGHTRDHQIIKIHSEDKTACFLADLVPMSSHLRTPYVMGYDLFPKQTMELKPQVLKQAQEENWLLFFEHDPEVQAGRLTEKEGKPQIESVNI